MSYQVWSVVFGEQPSASKWNILGTNDAGFNDGTAIANGVINSAHLTTALKAYNNRSSSEVATAYTFTDGDTIYSKTIDLGTLPNATTKNVAHGLTGHDKIVGWSGFAYTGAGGTMLPLPFPSSAGGYVEIYITSTNIVVIAASNRSSYNGHFTLFYTKV